jgi:hypothetical protein
MEGNIDHDPEHGRNSSTNIFKNRRMGAMYLRQVRDEGPLNQLVKNAHNLMNLKNIPRFRRLHDCSQ